MRLLEAHRSATNCGYHLRCGAGFFKEPKHDIQVMREREVLGIDLSEVEDIPNDFV
jgi:hypothetical protein